MSTDLEIFQWLEANPEFREKPATLKEFLGPKYLDLGGTTRKAIERELSEIMGDEVSPNRATKYYLAMVTGAIGIGKTTIASIVLPYLVHWVLCLKDPQGFFNLMPGSRIAFMQMSTSEKQAREVIFGDIKARINHSPWFKNHPFDPKFKNQFRFPKDVWIVPGDSAETTFEGYNILGGILDEADSHKVTETKDYADIGYDTIYNRMESRFGDRGFLLVIGQMKSASGFAARKYEEFCEREDAYAVRMAIWDSFGDEYYADEKGETHKFTYDISRKQIVPPELAASELLTDSENLIEIPVLYKEAFKTNPEKALKDLAGIPPAVDSPFISLTYKIAECRDRWVERHGDESPVSVDGQVADWFINHEPLKRVAHLDLAYSGKGDALGFAMGHVREMVEIDGELKPYIVIDMLYQERAPAGSEIFLGDVRRRIYSLRDHNRFKIDVVSMDGFESTDTRQQLNRRRIPTEYVSVDKSMIPYADLREAIYEDRIDFPPYMVRSRKDDTKLVEIAVQELSELVDTGKKVDHPVKGSKDIADAIAGVVFTLMGERRYHRKVVSIAAAREQKRVSGDPRQQHHAFTGASDFRTRPVPPFGGFPT